MSTDTASTRSAVPRSLDTRIFTHVMCTACLCLQRFGLKPANAFIYMALLVAPPLLAWLLLRGRATFRPWLALALLVMACCFLTSTIYAGLAPDPAMRLSIPSVIELILLYSLLTIGPTESFDCSRVLPIFLFYARLVAIAGVAQYALQFAGLRLFSFEQAIPALAPVSLESGYHTVAEIAYGSSTFRSNGFFLLEPSILSQVMAFAIVCDYFVLGRKRFLPLYAVATLVSYSGTGPLILGVTLLLVSFSSPKQLGRTIGLLAIVAIVAVAAAAVFPAEFATLAGRASIDDPSAHARYTGQVDLINNVIENPRIIVGFGPGAAEGYALVTGSMGTVLKLLLDYGFVGLIVFIVFIAAALWRSDKPIISLVCLIDFQLGGSYLAFSPLIFLMVLLCVWSRPSVRRAVTAVAPRRLSPMLAARV